ncbi:MAG: hypothetical protein IJ700_08220 [Bacteroidaceae bacterium]|nr:hypothetical protein [Bacteroidaceae bacterium]
MNDLFALSRAYIIIILLLSVPSGAMRAQTTAAPTTLEGWADRLTRFGNAIPQEKVFVHLDNTCYFLGDTIWYAAYTRRTDKDLPSNVSRVLYVELLNQDGFLVERQLVEMKGGRGHGNFVLLDTLYAGYYELRAYTRWQLNWGVTEKEHSIGAEDWFYNAAMAKEYYRDYDKLYSRVFPVYDKPLEPGDYYRDMTTRPLRRYFKSGAPEPQLVLSLFPEGGHVVAGLPCRVAFEAATESGEALEGRILPLPALSGQIAAEGVATVSRGRGVFTFTPEAGQDYEFTFTDKDGRTAKAKLPAAETDGVALSVERKGDAWEIQVNAAGAAATKPLGLTIMHEGRTKLFQELTGGSLTQIHYTPLLEREGQGGESGIHQVTVFDADGRIYADRLFFVTQPELPQPSLVIEGLKEEYEPFARAELQVTAPSLVGKAGGESVLSLAIRDAGTQDYTYDNGNIQTEMLLASELKGFIPNPAYFFEADDEEHRQALDLLMMTQGWRRFDWHTMATPGAFALTQPVESQTQILRGEVLNYSASMLQDDVKRIDMSTLTPFEIEEQIKRFHTQEQHDGLRKLIIDPSDNAPSMETTMVGMGQGEICATLLQMNRDHGQQLPFGNYRLQGTIATSRFDASEKALKKEVRVHAEFAQPGSSPVDGDMETRGGQFIIQAPRFEESCVFFLGASDTTKWKPNEKHIWVSMEETDDAEYYVRIAWPYPRFTKPYDFYHTTPCPLPQNLTQAVRKSQQYSSMFETNLQMITVRSRRGGQRRLNLSTPANVVDAYTAFNDACDAGLMTGCYRGRIHYINSLARLFVGDMGVSNHYIVEPRYDGRNITFSWTAKAIDHYNMLTHIDSVKIYTDYSPRAGGDPRLSDDNLGRLGINLQQLRDEGERVTYRDRRYILQGFNVADDFYHPNYQGAPPAEGIKDYRRTLYWNPDLQLDEEGKAHVTFFTGSKPAILTVDANGQAADGTLLRTPSPLHLVGGE